MLFGDISHEGQVFQTTANKESVRRGGETLFWRRDSFQTGVRVHRQGETFVDLEPRVELVFIHGSEGSNPEVEIVGTMLVVA